MNKKRSRTAALFSAVITLGFLSSTESIAAERPSILVIFGDDIDITNISRYSMGVMGYQAPNIDLIANERMIFTDYYGKQRFW